VRLAQATVRRNTPGPGLSIFWSNSRSPSLASSFRNGRPVRPESCSQWIPLSAVSSSFPNFFARQADVSFSMHKDPKPLTTLLSPPTQSPRLTSCRRIRFPEAHWGSVSAASVCLYAIHRDLPVTELPAFSRRFSHFLPLQLKSRRVFGLFPPFEGLSETSRFFQIFLSKHVSSASVLRTRFPLAGPALDFVQIASCRRLPFSLLSEVRF